MVRMFGSGRAQHPNRRTGRRTLRQRVGRLHFIHESSAFAAFTVSCIDWIACSTFWRGWSTNSGAGRSRSGAHARRSHVLSNGSAALRPGVPDIFHLRLRYRGRSSVVVASLEQRMQRRHSGTRCIHVKALQRQPLRQAAQPGVVRDVERLQQRQSCQRLRQVGQVAFIDRDSDGRPRGKLRFAQLRTASFSRVNADFTGR